MLSIPNYHQLMSHWAWTSLWLLRPALPQLQWWRLHPDCTVTTKLYCWTFVISSSQSKNTLCPTIMPPLSHSLCRTIYIHIYICVYIYIYICTHKTQLVWDSGHHNQCHRADENGKYCTESRTQPHTSYQFRVCVLSIIPPRRPDAITLSTPTCLFRSLYVGSAVIGVLGLLGPVTALYDWVDYCAKSMSTSVLQHYKVTNTCTCTVTNRHLSWYDLSYCLDVKLQYNTPITQTTASRSGDQEFGSWLSQTKDL